MPPFQFPILGFLQTGELTGFADAEALGTCFFMTYKQRAREGMLLVDMSGHGWMVLRVERIGTVGTFWRRVLSTVCRDLYYRVRYEFSDEGPINFDRIKKLVCRAIDRDPHFWFDEEFIVGESGLPQNEEALLDDLKTRVRLTGNMRELHDLFRTHERSQALHLR